MVDIDDVAVVDIDGIVSDDADDGGGGGGFC